MTSASVAYACVLTSRLALPPPITLSAPVHKAITQMPTTSYDVYSSDTGLNRAIEQYCDEHDETESQFFKHAARYFLEEHGYATGVSE